MLGRTAQGLFWTFRYLERSENAARLIDAGFRIALTRSASPEQEWMSVLAYVRDSYDERYDDYSGKNVLHFLLRDRSHPASVFSMLENARTNAKVVRTALTREVFEAINETYLNLRDMLARPISERELPTVLAAIRRQSGLVRGALHGTMLRNDGYSFARIGTYLERADNTARILDVKYFVLLPSAAHVGQTIDNVQWETILRALSALRSYRSVSRDQMSARGISEFLILDQRLPRSLIFCCDAVAENLSQLAAVYGASTPALELAVTTRDGLRRRTVDMIMDEGLHEALDSFIRTNNAIAAQIEKDYRFNE